MDVVIIMALIGILVFFVKRTFNGFIYSVGVIDILLRIISFIKVQLLNGEILNFLNKYVPESIPNMIYKYTNNTLSTILMWVYVAIMIVFEFYLIKALIKKK